VRPPRGRIRQFSASNALAEAVSRGFER